ncbi:hypothetical protein HK102_006735 [Quaeritorhiza haematococci]|nr:hypothetical protein HK102_006735 [Quaeritorhiza haematococci]
MTGYAQQAQYAAQPHMAAAAGYAGKAYNPGVPDRQSETTGAFLVFLLTVMIGFLAMMVIETLKRMNQDEDIKKALRDLLPSFLLPPNEAYDHPTTKTAADLKAQSPKTQAPSNAALKSATQNKTSEKTANRLDRQPSLPGAYLDEYDKKESDETKGRQASEQHQRSASFTNRFLRVPSFTSASKAPSAGASASSSKVSTPILRRAASTVSSTTMSVLTHITTPQIDDKGMEALHYVSPRIASTLETVDYGWEGAVGVVAGGINGVLRAASYTKGRVGGAVQSVTSYIPFVGRRAVKPAPVQSKRK